LLSFSPVNLDNGLGRHRVGAVPRFQQLYTLWGKKQIGIAVALFYIENGNSPSGE
jgi:hypothetical protein